MVLTRSAMQLALYYGIQQADQLQSRLGARFPTLAANLFLILGNLYKLLCVPLVLFFWRKPMRGRCSNVALAGMFCSIRYCTKAIFSCGIVLSFQELPVQQAIRVSTQAVAFRTLSQIVGRLGIVDALKRQMVCGCLERRVRRLNKLGQMTYEKELLVRVASTQVYIQGSGVFYTALQAGLPVVVNLPVNSNLREPALWWTLVFAIFSGIGVEIFLAFVMRKLRERRYPIAPKLSLCEFLSRMSEFGINEFVACGGGVQRPRRPIWEVGSEEPLAWYGLSPKQIVFSNALMQILSTWGAAVTSRLLIELDD